MTALSDLQVMLEECRTLLSEIGIDTPAHIHLELVGARSFYADAWRNQNKIRFSKFYMDAPVAQIRGTMVHELLHMNHSAGHGHGPAWKALADKVNAAYPEFSITRCGSQITNGISWDLRGKSGASQCRVLHRVVCNECGCTWTRTRESRLTLHPELYHCQCGGTLTRVF